MVKNSMFKPANKVAPKSPWGDDGSSDDEDQIDQYESDRDNEDNQEVAEKPTTISLIRKSRVVVAISSIFKTKKDSDKEPPEPNEELSEPDEEPALICPVLPSLEVKENDEERAFATLLATPGFEPWKSDLERLQQSIALWKQQELRPSRYAGISMLLSKQRKIQKFTDEMGDADGMYFVSGACDFQFKSNADMFRAMHSGETNVVVVANYFQAKTEKPKIGAMFDEMFSLIIDLIDMDVEYKVKTLIGELGIWARETYGKEVKFEGGLDGPYVEKFARRVATSKNHEMYSLHGRLTNELHRATERHTTRLLKERSTGAPAADELLILGSDLLGEDPDFSGDAAFKTKPWLELQAMVGMEEVKASLESLMCGLLLDFHRAKAGQMPLRSGLSKLFLGPPGSGKTTVAKLYGEILGASGHLSSGQLVVKNASDLIGKSLGHSEERTRQIIKDAAGKVLLIDEAYMLDPFRADKGRGDLFRQAVIDTIVGEIHNAPGEDICVIMCGYKAEMEEMIQRANPGLARRFPIADAFVFEEFTTAQLAGVLDYHMAKEGCTMTDEAKRVALEILNAAKQGRNFGNGDEVTNLIGRALANYRTRFGKMSAEQRSGNTRFEPEDIDPQYKQILCIEDGIKNAFERWDSVDHIVREFTSLARRVKARRRAGRDPVPLMPFHMVFHGPPGTGKRSVANKIGWLYKTLRLLSSEEVLEIEASDPIAETHVERREKISETLRKALGKVLFINDAHRLEQFAMQQLDPRLPDVPEALADVMNKPEFQHKVLVIIAGPRGLLHSSNTVLPRIASRFGTRVDFHPWTAKQCLRQMVLRFSDEGFPVTLTDKERKNIEGLFWTLMERRVKDWANGKDVESIANDVLGNAYETAAQEGEDNTPVVGFADIQKALQDRTPSASSLRGGADCANMYI